MNLTCLREPLSAQDLAFVRAHMGRVCEALDAAGGVFLDEPPA